MSTTYVVLLPGTEDAGDGSSPEHRTAVPAAHEQLMSAPEEVAP